MQTLSSTVKTTIPNYLSSLPIPDSLSGFSKLSLKDWMTLVPPTALAAGFVYMTYKAFCPEAQGYVKKSGGDRCNQSVRKHEAKVVDMVNIEDIADKAAFCRCWKTKNWPYCDGSHGDHNKRTGDNVGPVVIQRKKE